MYKKKIKISTQQAFFSITKKKMKYQQVCEHNNTVKRGNQYISGIKCKDCDEWIEKKEKKVCTAEVKKGNHGKKCKEWIEKKYCCKHNNTIKRGNQHGSGIKCKDCEIWVKWKNGKSNIITITTKNEKRRKDRPGYVYVMQGSNKTRVKIGRTKDPYNRLKNFKTADPDMRIIGFFETEDRVKAEILAHDKLSEYRTNRTGPGNEWFKVDKFDALDKVLEAVKEISKLLPPPPPPPPPPHPL